MPENLFNLLCLLLATFFFGALKSSAPWPLPRSLVAFWPLASETLLSDVANGHRLSNVSAKLATEVNGPFGEPNSAYTTLCDAGCYIGRRDRLPLSSSFTISFYIISELLDNGAILYFWQDSDPNRGPKLAINYVEPNFLEIWGPPDGENGSLIGRFPVLERHIWNFVAITYKKSLGLLNIYREDGKNIGFQRDVKIPSIPTTNMYLGASIWILGTGWATMKTTDAIACLMYYNTTLVPAQIAELPYACHSKGGASELIEANEVNKASRDISTAEVILLLTVSHFFLCKLIT